MACRVGLSIEGLKKICEKGSLNSNKKGGECTTEEKNAVNCGDEQKQNGD